MANAGVAGTGAEREKLEHLARYIARAPITAEKLALNDAGHTR